MIKVYNINTESHESEESNYIITRSSILSNPYTHLDLNKTRAIFQCKTREEAIERYSDYFDIQYRGNSEFKNLIDEIYQKFRQGENIYLGCVCKPLSCHGDIIKRKLQQRLIKEKIEEGKFSKRD